MHDSWYNYQVLSLFSICLTQEHKLLPKIQREWEREREREREREGEREEREREREREREPLESSTYRHSQVRNGNMETCSLTSHQVIFFKTARNSFEMDTPQKKKILRSYFKPFSLNVPMYIRFAALNYHSNPWLVHSIVFLKKKASLTFSWWRSPWKFHWLGCSIHRSQECLQLVQFQVLCMYVYLGSGGDHLSTVVCTRMSAISALSSCMYVSGGQPSCFALYYV